MSAFNHSYFQYIFGCVLSILIFTAGFIMHSGNAIVLIILLSVYLVLLSYEHVSCTENAKIMQSIAKLAVCIVFCLICRKWFFFIIFFTAFLLENALAKKFSFLLPSATYSIFGVLGLWQTPGAVNIIYVGILLLCGLLVFLVKKTVLKWRQSEKKLRDALNHGAVNELNERNLNRELAVKNYLIGQNARLEERERISRNIHNSVGHTITAAIMVLDAAEVLYDISPDKAKEKTHVAKERMHQGLDAIRSAVRIIDEAEAIGLDDFAKNLIIISEDFVRDSGIKIRHNLAKNFTSVKIPSQQADFLKGALLEALSNGVRHGEATAFVVLLSGDSQNLQLTVEDNGRIFSSLEQSEQKRFLEQGFGLKKIRKYCRENGGELKLYYSDGFKIVIKLPMISCEEDNL